MILLRLFWEFFKVGLFSVGGGLATIPFLYDISDKTGWYTNADLANMIAISESTPGPIGVNMATYVGYETAGFLGGFVTTLGIITPAFITILLIVKLLQSFSENKYVKSTFYGLRAASSGLIVAALFSVVKISLIDINSYSNSGFLGDLFVPQNIILAVVLYFLTNSKKLAKVHPAIFLGLSAMIGVLFKFTY